MSSKFHIDDLETERQYFTSSLTAPLLAAVYCFSLVWSKNTKRNKELKLTNLIIQFSSSLTF